MSRNSVTKVVIWDAEGLPPLCEGSTVLWRGFSDGVTSNVISIPRLIEENAARLRARYLAWVYDLGETRIECSRVVDHLGLRPDFSYWWMSLFVEKCNYSKSPQIDDAIRLMAFTDWAVAHPVKSLTLTSSNQPLAECMRLWCAKLGVAFEWQRQPKPVVVSSWLRRIYQTLPMPLQALVGLLKYAVDCFPLRGVGLKEWCQTEGQVTFFSYSDNFSPNAAKQGLYESHYWGNLPNLLRQEKCKTNWLHLYVADSILPTSKQAALMLSQFNGSKEGEQVHVALQTFLSFSVVIRTLLDWCRLLWVGFRLRKKIAATQLPQLNLWPLFENDWRQSMFGTVAMSNLLNLNMFETALKCLPKQQCGVYLQENQGWEFGLIHSWHAEGHNRLIGAPHSTVRYWDLRYFFDSRSYCRTGRYDLPMPNQVAFNGVAVRNAYINGGYPSCDLVGVEALRYLYLTDVKAKTKSHKTSKKNAMQVLVLGEYLPSNTQRQMNLLLQAYPSLPTGTVITVKPHPNCPIYPTDYPSLSLTVTMEPIVKLLADCDVAYSSAVTSAAVDAYCAGVPIVSMLDLNTLNLSPLRGCDGVLFASTADELSSALMTATSAPRRTSGLQEFFTIDPRLSRWRKLILD
jgi:surface carbohydrate biosynthesis protein (TIGR04326 family)